MASPYSPALIGDINKDGEYEIVVSSFFGNYFIFDHEGRLKLEFPTAGGWSCHSPAIGNIDEDPEIELVLPTGLMDWRIFILE